MAGEVVGGGRGQEDGRPFQVFDVPEPADRRPALYLGHELLRGLVLQVHEEAAGVGLEEARGYAQDVYPLRCQGRGEVAHQLHDALRGALRHVYAPECVERSDLGKSYHRPPTCTAGRFSAFGSASLRTSWVTGAVSPSPNRRKRNRYTMGLPSVQPKQQCGVFPVVSRRWSNRAAMA